MKYEHNKGTSDVHMHLVGADVVQSSFSVHFDAKSLRLPDAIDQ